MDYCGNCFETAAMAAYHLWALLTALWLGRRVWGSSELIAELLSVSDTKSLPSFPSPTERDTKGKLLCVFQGIGKFILLLGFLYLFVCSLDILSSAFQLVGGMNERVKGQEAGAVLIWSRPFHPHNSASPLQLHFRTGSHSDHGKSCAPFYRGKN